ncbi:MAG: carboxypeptidase-like regulatory domain-containing protein, partial [Elusimicrobiota bacterium]
GTVTSDGLSAYPASLGFYLDGQRVSSSYTDSEGHYTAVLTEPGEYQIGVLYKGSSSGFWITMVAGQSQVFDMDVTPNVSGTVTADGLPAENATVGFHVAGLRVCTAQTDEEGHYRALLREPGDYDVTMWFEETTTSVQVTLAAGQTLIVDFPPNTPSGEDVVVESDEGTTLTFDEVTGDGTTTVTESAGGQPPPTGFKLLKDYYEITTTAQYSGPITVSLAYDDTGLGKKEKNLKLMHLEGGNWVNVTTYLDMDNNVIYGEVSHLSEFAIMEQETIPAVVDIDPGTLNLASQGRWITCYITLTEGYDVAEIEAGTILLEGEIGASRSNEQDGVLMVKFERAALADLLQAGDSVELTVTGDITDGPAFEGSDTIRVIDSAGRKK